MNPTTDNLQQEISFLKQTLKENKSALRELFLLQEGLKKIVSSHDLSLILEGFIEIFKTHFTYQQHVYYQLDLEDLSFTPFHTHLPGKEIQKQAFEINESILTWILNEKQVSSIPASQGEGEQKSLLGIPMTTRETMLGVLVIQVSGESNAILTPQMRDLMNVASGHAAIAIENALLYQNMQAQNKKLEEMHSFTANILESLMNGVITFNRQGEITHVNRNATVMFGVTDRDPIGKNYLDTFPNSAAEVVHRLMEQTEQEGFVMDHQMDFELAGGVIIPYGLSTSLLKNAQGEILGMTFIIRDLTATKELDRLRSLDKLKSDFVSTVSHELRSPLATIRAYIDTLLNRVDPEDSETRTLFLRTVEEEANRLTTLVENMLNIAAIESGKIQLDLVPLSIEEILGNVTKLCQMQTQIHVIKTDVEQNLPKFNLDKDRMTQVLFNLVNNSIKYSPNGGDILITVQQKLGALRVDIQDSGLGIRPDDLKRLFEKFFRVDSQQTSNIGGTGLGLAIVKKLVELHGGKIEVASVYGKGSTFSVILPL